MVLASAITQIEDFHLICKRIFCTLEFACAVRAGGLGQVRLLRSALGRAPDFGSEVQFDVVTGGLAGLAGGRLTSWVAKITI